MIQNIAVQRAICGADASVMAYSMARRKVLIFAPRAYRRYNGLIVIIRNIRQMANTVFAVVY